MAKKIVCGGLKKHNQFMLLSLIKIYNQLNDITHSSYSTLQQASRTRFIFLTLNRNMQHAVAGSLQFGAYLYSLVEMQSVSSKNRRALL